MKVNDCVTKRDMNKMKKRVLLIILAYSLLVASAYANPLGAYINNLTIAGNDYVSGKISPDELECSVIENERFLAADKSVAELIASKDLPEIRRLYEVPYNKSSWEYGEKKASRDEKEKYRLKFQVLERVTHGVRDTEQSVIAYYNLKGDRPVVIYFTIEESRGKNWIYASMYPTNYNRFTNEGDAFAQLCLKKYLKPEAQVAIDNATQIIASAKNSGIYTDAAEKRLKESKEFLEKDNFGLAKSYSLRSIQLVEASRELNEYRSLSDEEKVTKLVQEWASKNSKDKIEMSEPISDEVNVDLGLIKQYNVFLYNESNSLYSYTEITDLNSRKRTTYYNQLTGDYDFYVGIDAKTSYEIMLMNKAEISESDYGKRYGIGIIKGDIKIRPFWKLYKLLSHWERLDGMTDSDFTKGVMSEIN
jgi:hypothetical protein